MKLIEIQEEKIYKTKLENTYYKRVKNSILRSNFFDGWDFVTIVNDVEELKREVFDMENIHWNIKYDTKNKELEVHIRQANMVIYLDNNIVQELLDSINTTMEAPF